MPSRQQPALEALTAIDATTIARILGLDAERGSGLFGRPVVLLAQIAVTNFAKLQSARSVQDFTADA